MRSVAVALLLACMLAATTDASAADFPFTVEKQQRLVGFFQPFTSAPLVGVVGETIRYRIVVWNPGEKAFGDRLVRITNATDEDCGLNQSWNPKEGPLVRQGYRIQVATCTHELTAADQTTGVFENSATVTGYERSPHPQYVTHDSNTVIVNIPPGIPEPKSTREVTCSSVKVDFTGFPQWTGNTVKERIRVDSVRVYDSTFTFDGVSSSNTVPITLGPGTHGLNVRSWWRTNGVRGGEARPVRITC